ncbi:MAG: phage tail protein [Cyanobacteria bacterium P01_C01_bin.121]
MVWGSLGDLNFEVGEAPTKLSYKESTQYTQHQRIEGKAVLQRTGEALQTLDLTFRFGIGWCDPDEQVRRLQQLRIDAKPLTLIIGNGIVSGNYVLENVSIDLTQTDAEGKTEFVDVNVKLLETVELPEPETLFSQARPFETRV